MTALSVCVFRGASAVPLYVAADEGIFEAAGLSVEVVPTRSSDELMEGLLDGRFQIVHCNPDNIIAWRDRTGEDIRAWVGGAVGPIVLIAGPQYTSVADLRGTEIAVDAIGSGWSPIMRRLLDDGGLGEDDYTLVPHGATGSVFAAVVEGRASAALVSIPWWLRARDAGLALLADHRSVLPRLQGSCGSSRSQWLATSPEAAVAYLRAVIAATTWMYAPENRGRLEEIVASEAAMSVEHAAALCETMLDPVGGWPASAMIDGRGIQMVGELRAEVMTAPLSAPEEYFTLEPYRAAMRWV